MAGEQSRQVEGVFTSELNNIVQSSPIVTTAKEESKNISKNVSSLSSQMSVLGADAAEIFTDEEQYKELLNATGNAALEYLNSKINQIKAAWNTKVEVSVKSLIGEVAPYVTNFEEAAKVLNTKISSLMEYVTGTGENSLLSELGNEAINAIADNPSMQNALSSLSIVKTYADIFTMYDTIYKTVESVLKIVEPLIPVLKIVANLAMTFFSGGTSAAEAAQEVTELRQQLCQQLLSLATQSIRKYVYSIKIKLPSLLVGALNTLSVREAMASSEDVNGWLKAIFSEDFYNSTLYSLQWQDSIFESIEETMGSFNDMAHNWEKFNFVDMNGNPIGRGEFMKSKFMTTLTQKFMKQAVATARKTAHLSNYTSDRWKTNTHYELALNDFNVSNSDVNKTPYGRVYSSLDMSLDNDMDLSPLSDLESLRLISGQLIANL